MTLEWRTLPNLYSVASSRKQRAQGQATLLLHPRSFLVGPFPSLTPSWKVLWFPEYGPLESRAWTSQLGTGFAGPWSTPGRILGTRAERGHSTAEEPLEAQGAPWFNRKHPHITAFAIYWLSLQVHSPSLILLSCA